MAEARVVEGAPAGAAQAGEHRGGPIGQGERQRAAEHLGHAARQAHEATPGPLGAGLGGGGDGLRHEAVAQARHHRREAQAHGHAGLGQGRHGAQPRGGGRRAGLEGPGQRRVEQGDGEGDPHGVMLSERAQQVEIAQDEGGAGDDGHGVAVAHEQLEAGPGDALVPLDALVGVGDPRHHHRVPAPAGPRQLGLEQRCQAALDQNDALKVAAGAEPQGLVGLAGVAVGAGVGAAPVGVEREPVAQVGALVLADGRAGVIDLHPQARRGRREVELDPARVEAVGWVPRAVAIDAAHLRRVSGVAAPVCAALGKI